MPHHFMKASHDKSKKSGQGVSFGALETKDTIDKHSIDPRYIRIEVEHACKDKATMNVETGPIVEIGTNPVGVEEIFSIINRSYRSNYRNRSGSRNYRYGNNYWGSNNAQSYSRNNYR